MLTSYDLANVSIGTRIRKKYFISYFKNMRFGKTLECGCGLGTYTNFLKTISSFLVSFDVNNILITAAKKYTLGSEFLTANIMMMPFKDECFDLIISADVIEHTNNVEKTLSEITRVTKENSIFAFSVPSLNWKVIFKILNQTQFNYGHNYIFGKKELISLLNKKNFEIIYYKKIQGFFTSILEGLIIKVSSSLFGNKAAKDSQMTVFSSKNKILSLFYFWGSKILYPIFMSYETFIPKILKFEHFVVAKKK